MRIVHPMKPVSAALLLTLCAVASGTPAGEAAPAGATAGEAVAATDTGPAPAPATDTGAAREAAPAELLAAHNRYRAALKIAPLTWSDELATSARAWAKDLVVRHRFEHSKSPHGENLWMGTAGAYAQTDMVKTWGDEQAEYVHGVFPRVTKGGVVGHYTQMIWRNTSRVGCGLATGKGVEVLVCHYDPPGNYYGQTPY